MPILLNQSLVECSTFAGGEAQVSIAGIELGARCEILADLRTANDIMSLLLTVDAVRRRSPEVAIALTIPYFPYARQDRVCNPGEALSVHVMADLINNLRCDSVTIMDPHSEVTAAALKNCKTITQADIVANTSLGKFITENELAIISPDAGAAKKSRLVAERLANTEVLFAEKHRDSKSGAITGSKIHGDVAGKSLIILDDICDGGRTFIELSKELKKAGAAKMYLYTTHGIYARGLETLKLHFEHLFCYHDMRLEKGTDREFLTVLEDESPVLAHDKV